MNKEHFSEFSAQSSVKPAKTFMLQHRLSFAASLIRSGAKDARPSLCAVRNFVRGTHYCLFARGSRFAVLGTLIALTSAFAYADFGSSAKGTTTANFLKLGVGARAAAMGEAYSALADEASALYWNPAALNQIDGKSATLMHAAYVDNSYFDYAAYGQKTGIGGWGLGVTYLSAGRIAETSQGGAIIGDFNPNDLAISLGYAYPVAGFSLGASGKYIRSEIVDSATAFAADLGILSPSILDDRLNLAFTVTNLGTKMKFDQEKEDLPLAIRLGSGLAITQSWKMGLDIAFPKDNDPYGAVGTEYTFRLKAPWAEDSLPSVLSEREPSHSSPDPQDVHRELGLALRAGYNSRTTGNVDGVTGVSTGLGFSYQKLSVDYGFVPLGSLGLTHRVSLSLKF